MKPSMASRPSFKTRQAQAGISLVEILIALVISLFLLGGIIQVYLGNTATYKFASALSQVQENGRFAMDMMSQDLRSVDDWGCIEFNPFNKPVINNDTITNISNKLIGQTGYDATVHDFITNPSIRATNNSGGLGTTDTVTISGSLPGQANIKSPFSLPNDTFVTVNRPSFFSPGDVALITRCGPNDLIGVAEAEIQRVTSVDTANSKLSFATDLSQQYENDAVLKRLQTITYSIANSASEPTLFRSEFGDNQELIEGIEDMQILYGLDTDSDAFANQYVTSNNVADFRDIVSIRIMLLVRSTDAFVTDQPQVIPFNGAANANPGDRRLRQVFTSTIALRNRAGVL